MNDWSDASLVEGVTVEIDGILLEGAIIFDNGHACLCQLLKYLPNFVPVLGESLGPDEEVIDTTFGSISIRHNRTRNLSNNKRAMLRKDTWNSLSPSDKDTWDKMSEKGKFSIILQHKNTQDKIKPITEVKNNETFVEREDNKPVNREQDSIILNSLKREENLSPADIRKVLSTPQKTTLYDENTKNPDLLKNSVGYHVSRENRMSNFGSLVD